MVGRATLFVILGFSLIFGIADQYWNRNGNDAVGNFVSYYDQTAAHNIAVSAANIAADSMYFDPTATLDESADYSGGTMSFSSQKHLITPGDTGVMITAIGKYPGTSGDIYDTVQVVLSPTPFSRYAFFSNNENSTYWITGDTLTGPFHTNGAMYLSGAPVFNGSVSVGSGIMTQHTYKPIQANQLPDRYGDTLKTTSYQSGTNIPIPTSLSQTTAAATYTFANGDANSGDTYDVYLTFNSNPSTVSYYTVLYTAGNGQTTRVPATGDSTVPLSTFAPGGTGVIVVKNGDVHVSGQLDGQVTVAAMQGTGTSSNAASPYSSSNAPANNLYAANGNTTHNGNVLIDGNLTYYNNPQTDPSSTDMLGLVADNSVALEKQASSGNVTIDAAVFARQGEFLYTNYNKGSAMGYLDLYGSITNNTRGAVGTFSGSTLQTGYHKDYYFDQRLATGTPPGYPTSGKFQILSWRE